MKKTFGLLRLTRPANIVTAIADILAGVAIAGFFVSMNQSITPILWLVLSTIGLYGGGVVFNDVFDTDLDRAERPERPIPSGLVSITEASVLGGLLLISGILAASMVSSHSALIALAIAFFALVYDKWGKHHSFLGPLNMGLCRGLNLLLGISIVASQLQAYWYVAAIPIIYIAAITMISRGEVHGGSRKVLYTAALLYAVVMVSILLIAVRQHKFPETILFVVFWGIMIFVPLQKAIRTPEGKFIGRAVKAGVIALIIMNAAWAAAFGMIPLAFVIILLLPLSLMLARLFAVT